MASRLDFSQIRSLYVGTIPSTTVDTNNLIVAGNVGIGTTAPAEKLHVVGIGRFDGVNVNVRAIDGTIITKIQSQTVGGTQGAVGTESNNDLAVVTNNTTRMLVTAAGNVGIGTTDPSTRLQVLSSQTNSSIRTGGLEMQSYDVNNSWYAENLYFDGGSWRLRSTGFATQMYMQNGTIDFNRVATGAGGSAATLLTTMRLFSNGNILIGTTTDNGYKLNVNGDIYSNGDVRAQGIYRDYQGEALLQTNTSAITQLGSGGAGTPRQLAFLAGNAERVRIDTNGNVGIGTTAPNALLSISKTISSDTRFLEINNAGNNQFRSDIDFTVTAGGITVGRISSIYPSSNNVGLSFSTYGTSPSTGLHERMRINGSDGNVGIGTTGPTEKLHVDGSTLITYNNSFQSTNSVGNKAILARVSPTSGIINYAEYATATNLNGFVIGSDDARVKGNIATDSLEFITNTSTRMTILSGGNVGINTTTPGSTLHVIGDVLIQTGALGVGVSPNATDGRIDASNDIVAFSTSDKRLKENITPIANALEKVRSLTGVEFDWKEETKSVHGYEGHDVGVIAQDVQAVLPEAVRTNDSGYLSVRYEKMIALLVEAMKEQQAQIDELKKLIK